MGTGISKVKIKSKHYFKVMIYMNRIVIKKIKKSILMLYKKLGPYLTVVLTFKIDQREWEPQKINIYTKQICAVKNKYIYKTNMRRKNIF